MANEKWSSFTDVGAIQSGDKTVGLREGANASFNPLAFNNSISVSGDIIGISNIADSTDAPLLNFLTAGGTIANYIQIQNGQTDNFPGIYAVGSDSNVGINFVSQGNAAMGLYTAAPTEPFVISSGTDYQHYARFVFSNTENDVSYTFQDTPGTLAYTSQLPSSGSPLALSSGGTGADLTASNNSIVYSNSSTLTLLATADNSVLGTDASGNLEYIGYSSTTSRGGNIVIRDSDGNIGVNSLAIGTTSTASTGGTINLYIGSSQAQIITGTMNETMILPQATTLVNGWTYLINNASTGIVTIQTYGGGALTTISPGAYSEFYLINDATSAGTWTYTWLLPQNVIAGSAGLTYPGYLATSPSNSAASSLSLGSAYQNALGYDVILTVYIAISSSTGASITSGVGSSNTPMAQTIVSSLTTATTLIVPVTVYLPNAYYALISTSGTISASISGQQVTPV